MPGAGAVVSFTGVVRDVEFEGGGGLTAMEIEHYPGMTEAAIAEILSQALPYIRKFHGKTIVI